MFVIVFKTNLNDNSCILIHGVYDKKKYFIGVDNISCLCRFLRFLALSIN